MDLLGVSVLCIRMDLSILEESDLIQLDLLRASVLIRLDLLGASVTIRGTPIKWPLKTTHFGDPCHNMLRNCTYIVYAAKDSLH